MKSPSERRAANVSARARERRKITDNGFDAETQRWFEAMAYEDHASPMDAARAVGMSQAKARRLVGMPTVQREFQRRMTSVRTSEGLRNLHVLRLIRERAIDPDATAAQQKASIEAMRLLEGREDDRRPLVSIGTVNAPGLVIDLSAFGPPPPGVGGGKPMLIDATPTREEDEG